jgi:hypothetical protein
VTQHAQEMTKCFGKTNGVLYILPPSPELSVSIADLDFQSISVPVICCHRSVFIRMSDYYRDRTIKSSVKVL